MNNIPTAEEYLVSQSVSKNNAIVMAALSNGEHTVKRMIEFAKLHVEAALKAASEKVKMKIREDIHELDMNDDWMEVDKNSILTAYSLDDIV